MMLDLRKSFYLSISVHTAIAAVMIGYPLLYKLITNKSLFDTQLRKIPEAVRVDLVGMPTLTLKELDNLPRLRADKIELEKQVSQDDFEEKFAKENSKEENKEDVIKEGDEVLLKEEKEKVKKKKEKKEKATKKKKEKKKSKLGKKEKKKALSDLKSLILAGNILSEGESATGEVNELELAEIDRYALKVKNKIKPHWNLPSFLLELDLRSKVRVYINKEGELIRMALIEKSGNEEYDIRVRKAVELAEPFDAPGEEIQEAIENGELVLVFPF